VATTADLGKTNKSLKKKQLFEPGRQIGQNNYRKLKKKTELVQVMKQRTKANPNQNLKFVQSNASIN
jgi:hypothetical protein